MKTMKAVRIHQYGDPEVLCYEDAPIPTIGDGQVLIRIHAASVNPYDAAVRQGYMTDWVKLTFPFILGWDASGVVEEVGSGVTNVKVGDEVYARPDPTKNGTYAEYVAADASAVAHKPRSLSHQEAAAVPHAALTAWQMLFLADLKAGQTVLIHGAAGGVGHFAVQFAKWRGANVIGTTSVHKQDFLRSLGADQVIDYTTTRFEDATHGVDVVLDNVGGETQDRSWSVLKPGGILISPVQPPSAETAASYGVRQAFIYTQSLDALREVATLIDQGKVKPVIASVLPLAEVQQAHAMIQTRHTHGKIVLRIAD